jgi:hypothetical protein
MRNLRNPIVRRKPWHPPLSQKKRVYADFSLSIDQSILLMLAFFERRLMII